MFGAGFIADMNNRIKQNRALRRQPTPFKEGLRETMYVKEEDSETDFNPFSKKPVATPETLQALKQLREELHNDRKRRRRLNILCMSVMLLIVIIVLWIMLG